MINDYIIEQLQEIRKSSRKMHSSYLQKTGLLDYINELVPNDFKIKEKIDIILLGKYDKCDCGELTKPNSKWCSISCRNKDPEIRKSIGIKNSENKDTRVKKAKETLFERYGVYSLQDIPEAKQKTKETKQKYYDAIISETFNRYNLDIILFSDKEYLEKICTKSSYNELSKKHFNGMPNMTILRHFIRIGFDPKFGNKGSSMGEREVLEFVQSLNLQTEIISVDKQTIKPLHLDIHVPAKKIAIEFNGLYYHNSDKFRHLTKTKLCQEKGIVLLNIFEDEWYFKCDIIKSIIKTKLGIYENKIYARNTNIGIPSTEEAEKFIETNHIQGSAVCSNYYGLYYNNELVSILSVGRHRFLKGKFEIIRYCNKLNTQIIGGFSKLLKRAKIDYDELYSYSNLRFFDGEIYEKFGTFLSQTEPGYYWTNPSLGIRVSRYKTQKNKLGEFLKTKFNKNLTEEENMVNAGYLQIWDCGNKHYRL